MLVEESMVLDGDPILKMVAMVNGNEETAKCTERVGVYHIGHFGSSDFLRPFYKSYLSLTDKDGEYFGSYGVCDNVEQILARCPLLVDDPVRKFVITLTAVVKAHQSSDGGWRWHKWGEYIGDHDIQCEYLYHEVGIEQVFVYHIYEQRQPGDDSEDSY